MYKRQTLLGADDKAGVAEIMDMAASFLLHPERPHGEIRIAFTPVSYTHLDVYKRQVPDAPGGFHG